MICYTVDEIAVMLEQCEAAQLENRTILYGYSNSELTGIMNGIGAGWMSRRLRLAVSNLNPSLLPVALIHDVECYEALAGEPGEAEFAASNRRFRCNGCRMAEHRYPWYHPLRYYVKFKAKTFAGLLMRFGRSCFFREESGC